MTLAETLIELAQIHPGLRSALKAIDEEWAPEPPPPTLASSELGRSLVTLSEAMSDSEIQSVFVFVDRVLSEGSDLAQDMIATGFLEAIVAASERGQFAGSRLISFAGPCAAAYCAAWKAYG